MAKSAYTLKKMSETDECHLFKGEFTDDGCTSKRESICKGMNKTDSSGNVFTCKDENAARLACAKKGRVVCGVCVSSLYATY